MNSLINRRRLLRGAVSGASVVVALPFLDCFLDGNGTALASGAPLPTRFATWFWGLGVTPNRWQPTKVGPDWDVLPEAVEMTPLKHKISIFSGFDALLDGNPNFPHFSGSYAFRTGIPPSSQNFPGVSFDVAVADAIGTTTRFRSLEVSAFGSETNTLSGRGAGQMYPSETSALALYNRIFGQDFKDPNAADFRPDPAIIARRSVLSGITEERQALERKLGSSDRARLDQYFTALRQVENQLSLQLEKPAPMVACSVPKQPEAAEVYKDIADVSKNHEIMAQLLAMALACNQTKVVNMHFSNGSSALTRRGGTTNHHTYTHDEPVDTKLGYQPTVTLFVEDTMKAWGTFVKTLDSVKEGDRTLLDNMLVVAHSDSEYARVHLVTNLPFMFAGSAGGRLKTGLHVARKNEPCSQVALTAMQAVGVKVEKYGAGSMETNKTISEVVA